MALSRELLGLVESVRWPADDSIAYLRFVYEADLDDIILTKEDEEDGTTSEEIRAGSHRIRDLIRGVISEEHRSNLEPRLPSVDEIPRDTSKEWPADLLDDFFTVKLLQSVRGTTRRWTRLKTLRVVTTPADARVQHYMRQATTCYLYGMFEATTVLCRAVLEFALRDQLSALGGLTPGQHDCGDLIRLAVRTGLLTGSLTDDAKGVQLLGNKAIHRERVEGGEALLQLQRAARVLCKLYGSKKEAKD